MTVASLWKALDSAGCGKPIGTKELASGKFAQNRTETVQRQQVDASIMNNNSDNQKGFKRPCLAVDLSIWICESLTSSRMDKIHTNPSLYLVFSRTIRLLSLGIKLVFVVEGKRRIRSTDNKEKDKFRKRRSGTVFWKACQDCQEMLKLLGVLVLQAKAEGEALCALLNQRGIVDGVISNDGDCLLFGAPVVYTRFSIENLENSRVIRYCLNDLSAAVVHGDRGNNSSRDEQVTTTLSRQDLIAFALLTGSDMAGNGFPKVGHKKAVRFILKCQLDNPLKTETAAIEEMKAWARAASANVPAIGSTEKKKAKCCSRCSHPGSCRSHLKHGCVQCGTKPGEPCFQLTTEDRFRKALRLKAIALRPKFEPSQVVSAYMRPNDNQVPVQVAKLTSSCIEMETPQLNALLQVPLIIKGQSLDISRKYVMQKVAQQMARADLFRRDTLSIANDVPRKRGSREHPVPQRITKSLLHNRVPCYELTWLVHATLTDEVGNGIDGYEFSTIEEQQHIKKYYPNLIATFCEAEKERKKQGDGEQTRRREFLTSQFYQQKAVQGQNEQQTMNCKRKAEHLKKRGGFFESRHTRVNKTSSQDYGGNKTKDRPNSDDVCNLLRFMSKSEKKSQEETFDFSSIETTSDNLSLDSDAWSRTKESKINEHGTSFRQQPERYVESRSAESHYNFKRSEYITGEEDQNWQFQTFKKIVDSGADEVTDNAPVHKEYHSTEHDDWSLDGVHRMDWASYNDSPENSFKTLDDHLVANQNVSQNAGDSFLNLSRKHDLQHPHEGSANSCCAMRNWINDYYNPKYAEQSHCSLECCVDAEVAEPIIDKHGSKLNNSRKKNICLTRGQYHVKDDRQCQSKDYTSEKGVSYMYGANTHLPRHMKRTSDKVTRDEHRVKSRNHKKYSRNGRSRRGGQRIAHDTDNRIQTYSYRTKLCGNFPKDYEYSEARQCEVEDERNVAKFNSLEDRSMRNNPRERKKPASGHPDRALYKTSSVDEWEAIGDFAKNDFAHENWVDTKSVDHFTDFSFASTF